MGLLNNNSSRLGFGHVVIVSVILFIAVLASVGYVAYDKFVTVKEEDSSVQNENSAKDQSINVTDLKVENTTDIDVVISELDKITESDIDQYSEELENQVQDL